MANFYSDHFSGGGTAAALPDARVLGRVNAPRGTGGTSRKMKRGYIDMTAAGAGDYADGDVLALVQIKSNDRIHDMLLTTDDSFDCATSIDMDLGIYESTMSGDVGAAVDVDCFMDGVDIDATAANTGRIDAWTSATTLTNLDRGKLLWEALDDAGVTTYGADPNEMWIIAATLNVTGAVAGGGLMLLEVKYTDA
jgi:hypothetical protein